MCRQLILKGIKTDWFSLSRLTTFLQPKAETQFQSYGKTDRNTTCNRAKLFCSEHGRRIRPLCNITGVSNLIQMYVLCNFWKCICQGWVLKELNKTFVCFFLTHFFFHLPNLEKNPKKTKAQHSRLSGGGALYHKSNHGRRDWDAAGVQSDKVLIAARKDKQQKDFRLFGVTQRIKQGREESREWLLVVG